MKLEHEHWRVEGYNLVVKGQALMRYRNRVARFIIRIAKNDGKEERVCQDVSVPLETTADDKRIIYVFSPDSVYVERLSLHSA